MVEPTGGEIRRGDSFSLGACGRDDDPAVTRGELASTLLEALDQLAHAFDLAVPGQTRIELTFQDGRFEAAWLHRRVARKQLGEFEPVFRATSSASGSE
jgi:hypothetical protein